MNHSARPSGAVIVLNWNGAAWLDGCLSTLAAQSVGDFELVVVDNASTDSSAEVALKYPIRWLQLDRNYGFSRGNNAGARATSGDWLVFVNNDMRFEPTFVETVVAKLMSDSGLFAIDVAQRDWAGNPSHGAIRLTRQKARSVGRRRLVSTESFPKEPTLVPFGNGGALCVRRSHFEQLGGWDERMFAGSEDVDLSWRAWRMGWGTLWIPDYLAHAKIGGASSTPEGRRLRRRAVVSGRLVHATKNLPLTDAFVEWAALASRAALRADLRAPFKEILGLVPELIRERRSLYRGTTPSLHLDKLMRLDNE